MAVRDIAERTAAGAADLEPVSGAVAGAGEVPGIDERLGQLCVATHNSPYVEFGVMLSWAEKPLPRNEFGGIHST